MNLLTARHGIVLAVCRRFRASKHERRSFQMYYNAMQHYYTHILVPPVSLTLHGLVDILMRVPSWKWEAINCFAEAHDNLVWRRFRTLHANNSLDNSLCNFLADCCCSAGLWEPSDLRECAKTHALTRRRHGSRQRKPDEKCTIRGKLAGLYRNLNDGHLCVFRPEWFAEPLEKGGTQKGGATSCLHKLFTSRF